MVMDPDADPWLARDKLHHILFCFSLTILFSLLASQTPHAFIRNRNILLGSLLSLLAGAAKEIADHLGFFQSAGASAKDAVAVAAPNPTRLSNIAGFPLFDWSNFGEFGAPRSPFPSDKRHNELGWELKG